MRRAKWLFASLAVWISCQGLVAQSTNKIYEDFRNTPLADAIHRLKGHGLEFNYVQDQVSNKHINLIIDSLSPAEAVDLLLAGTGLSWDYSETRKVFMIYEEGEALPSSVEVNPPQVLLRGRVTDWSTGAGVASVVIQNLSSPEEGILSDEEGYFELVLSRPQLEILLEARIVGYKHYTARWSISSAHKPLNIRLHQQPIEIEDVVIARQQEPPVSMDSRTQEIRLRPQKFGAVSGLGENDMMRTVQLMPGVMSENESATNLFIRGGSPEHNLLLFDGITMYQGGHFFGMVSSFNSEAVEEVRMQRGGFGARYGGRLSSIIEVKTKPQKPDSLRLGLGMNALNGQVLLEVPFAKKGDKHQAAFLLSGRRSTTDLIHTWLYQNIFDQVFQRGVIHDNQQPRQENFGQEIESSPRFYFGDVNAKVIFQPDNKYKDHLSLSVFGGKDHLDYESIIPQGKTDILITHRNQLKLSNKGLSGTWEREWSEAIHAETNVAYSSFDQNYGYIAETRDPNNGGNNYVEEGIYDQQEQNTIQDLSIRQHISWQPDPEHIIEGGAQFNRLQTGQSTSLSKYEIDGSNLNTLASSLQEDSAYLYHSYLQYAYQPVASPLSLKAGLRHTYFSHTDQHYLAPRVSIQFDLSDKWMLKGAFGQYRQFISRIDVPNELRVGEDFWMLADGDSLPVARAMHVITGIAFQTKGMLFDLEIYHKELADLTTYPQTYVGRGLNGGFMNDMAFINDGSGRAIGLDVLLKKTFSIPNGTLTGLVSYSLSQVKYSFPEIEASRPFYADHDQRHSAKWSSTLNLARWNFSTTWTFASGRPYTPATGITVDDHARPSVSLEFGERNSARLPVYHRLDLSGSYKFSFMSGTRQGNIGVSLFNVYNRKNIKSREFIGLVSPDEEEELPQILAVDRLLLGLSPNLFLNVNF